MKMHAELTREIRRGPRGPQVAALFDLDRTLIAGFSMVTFTRERARAGYIGAADVGDALVNALSFGFGVTEFSDFVDASTSHMRGELETDVEAFGQVIFDKHLATEIYPEARALVEAHLAMGHTVAIVSSATRYQAGPVARDLRIPHVLCTEFEVSGGKFTGKVVRPLCYGEGKVLAARKLAAAHGLNLADSYFYSDSDEDLPLLERVGRPRPLNPNPRLARVAEERKWPHRSFASRGTPSVESVARTAMVYGSIIPSVVAGVTTGLMNSSWREGVNTTASMWGDLATSLAGIDLHVKGEKHLWSHRPAVFLFNHQSGFDPILMAKLVRRDLTGISKQEVLRNPVFGPLFSAAGAVFIDRADGAGAIEAMAPAVEALEQGTSLMIAPEGTRSPTPRLAPFKKGAFHIAMQAGVPIVPVVFRNVLDALPKNAFFVRPARVEVVVLPPVKTKRWKLKKLDQEVEAIRNSYLEILGQH